MKIPSAESIGPLPLLVEGAEIKEVVFLHGLFVHAQLDVVGKEPTHSLL